MTVDTKPEGLTKGEKAALLALFVLLATPLLYFWVCLADKLLKALGIGRP